MRAITLRTKLVGGFLIAAAIALLVGVNGWVGVSRVGGNLEAVGREYLPSIYHLKTIDLSLTAIDRSVRTLLNPNMSEELRNHEIQHVVQAHEELEKARGGFDALPKTPDEEALWKETAEALAALRKANDEFFRLSGELEKTGIFNPLALRKCIEQFRGDHLSLSSKAFALVNNHTEFDGGEDATQCNFGKWMADFKTGNGKLNEILRSVRAHHDAFHASVKEIKNLVKSGDMEDAESTHTYAMLPAEAKVFEHFDKLRQEVGVAESLYAQMQEQAIGKVNTRLEALEVLTRKLEGTNEQESEQALSGAETDAFRAKIMALAGMIGGASVALGLGIFLALSITRPIKRVVDGLSDGSEQVASASEQVSSASQQLAEGASEQASAIEETSSSLEEMSSMTRQNAENSRLANQSMTEVRGIVDKANASMQQMTLSMAKINKASEETQKIIKTIDEIAFQTNLLALNAAVEAARAGEAGAGFAVVADEVRNLAMRAAEAAKNTAALIEGTVKTVKGGSDLVESTSKDFSKVAVGVAKAGELIGEIAAASREQAQGIEQVNKAISEMDRVTQQNAADAEESAAAAEEMSAQAAQTMSFVHELSELIGGTRRNGGEKSLPLAPAKEKPQSKVVSREERRVVLTAGGSAKRKGNGHAKSASMDGDLNPEKIIPLRDEEFQDF